MADETPEQRAVREKAEADAAAKKEAERKEPVPREQVDALYARLKRAEEERDALTKAAKDQKDKELSEGERLAKKVAELEPAAEKVKTLEKELSDLLEQEEKDFPAQYRDLIPDGLPPLERLKWIRKNRGKLVDKQKVPGTPNGRPGTEDGEVYDSKRIAELAELAKTDPVKYAVERAKIQKAASAGLIKR